MRAVLTESARALVATCVLALGACDKSAPSSPRGPMRATRFVRTDTVPGCSLASPLLVRSRGTDFVLTVNDDGVIRAYEPDTGTLGWTLTLSAPAGYVANMTATPVLFADGSRLVVAYQEMRPDALDRIRHLVVVVDLEARALDSAFAPLELTASRPSADGTANIPFLPTNSFSRATLVLARPSGSERGLVYVSFGNIRDIQPWHGWVFELDLDRWHDTGTSEAIANVLLTTPEADCGTPGVTGSEDMICGAGVWAPAGPKLVPGPGGEGDYELWVPTGNGQLDLARHDYANTLMRLRRGLTFDPGCDAAACAGFDIRAPSAACLASCEHLFVPRLLPSDPPFRPASGACDGLSFFECYAVIDWDLGANSPLRVELDGGPVVVVLPAKDGGVYLFDAEHFGHMYDRVQVAEVCGARGDTCTAQWAGMMVTEPVLTHIGGKTAVLVPTFEFDRTHPAGVVALTITMQDGAPKLTRAWTAPDFATPEALSQFRDHPGRVVVTEVDGHAYALVVDVSGYRPGPGRLYVIDVETGAITDRVELDGEGQRYVKPLLRGDSVYVTSCGQPGEGPGHVEGFRLHAAVATE